jgi:O-methyltransferase involved in polyketide biosynthesis
MLESTLHGLSDVAETLLIPLLIRANESKRPDALLEDENAVALVRLMDQELLSSKLADIQEEARVAVILRSREFDRCAREFLTRHPEAVVVHIGCGLDARFERADDGQSDRFSVNLCASSVNLCGLSRVMDVRL